MRAPVLVPNHAIARVHAMPHGAAWQAGTGTRFRLWAPAHARIDLVIEGPAPEAGAKPETGAGPKAMRRLEDGWHEIVEPRATPGTRYRFGLPDGSRVPDPASRFQPEDVHGPSEVVDPAAYRWTDAPWHGRPWRETVLYELHLGAFTPAGTFLGAIEKFDHLKALGVNAIEIMPVADFTGTRNWGYDGVLPYAPDGSYGRPEDFKALVEAAHARGISVLLDVVYNHFGPDGNYLGAYAPGFFTERHQTPWGAAINFDGPESRPVRDFVIHNALYWLEEYHLDGLRLDAVHAIVDDGATHLLEDLAQCVRAAVTDRPVHLIVEDEDNVARRLGRTAERAPRLYTAQWNDDVHHVLHVAASKEASGYYGEYCGDSAMLGRALAEGFGFQGQMMLYRGHERGEPSAALPPEAFVAFIQNHDQIGNRAFGNRIDTIASPQALRAITALYLLLPQIPMLFMGEEWAASTPFLFFCDFHGELAEAVRRGRRAEFASFPEFQDEAMRERIPDPQAESSFAASKLRWDEATTPAHADMLGRYTALLALRRARILPLLETLPAHGGTYDVIGPLAVTIRWRGATGTELILDANLKDSPEAGFQPPGPTILWQDGEATDWSLGPWAIRWSLTEGNPS